MNNVIYSRTMSYPDKEDSPRLMAWIGLTEETNGYGLFEEIRVDGETEETKLVCWHFKWDRAGAIEHAVEYIRNKQQTWHAETKISSAGRSRNLQAATMDAVRLRLRRPGSNLRSQHPSD